MNIQRRFKIWRDARVQSWSRNQAPTHPASTGPFWKLTSTHHEQSDVIVLVIGEEFCVAPWHNMVDCV